MVHCLRSACAAAMFVGALALSADALSKPPGLPEKAYFEVLPMPREDTDVTCPYLRQQKTDCPAFQSANPEMSGDVLENLERLKQADHLMDLAEDLAQEGFLAEAMECCTRAAKLCPGSPCAERAVNVMLELELAVGSIRER